MPVRKYVGALLLTTPAINKPATASVFGVCRECWIIQDLSLEAIERMATEALQAVIPGGKFEPLNTR